MRLLLLLLPILGCQASASRSGATAVHVTQATADASEYRLMQLQVGISQADMLIDVLELCELAMSEATSNEKPEMVRVCSRERLRRRSDEAPDSP